MKVDLKDVVSDVDAIKKGNQGDNILVKGEKYLYKDESQKEKCCNYEFLILNAKCQKDVSC